MPIVPIRGLAEKGILRDPSPYELDLTDLRHLRCAEAG